MSQANVNIDIARFKQNGIINVRTYAQECDQLEQILNAIAAAGGGMTVVAAVWIDGTFLILSHSALFILFFNDL